MENKDFQDLYRREFTPSEPKDYWAINLDLKTSNEKDAAAYTVALVQLLNIDLSLVLERKKKNNHFHIHSYFDNSKKKYTQSQLVKTISYYFSGKSFKINPVFDLAGWEDYMTKHGSRIVHFKDQKVVK